MSAKSNVLFKTAVMQYSMVTPKSLVVIGLAIKYDIEEADDKLPAIVIRPAKTSGTAIFKT